MIAFDFLAGLDPVVLLVLCIAAFAAGMLDAVVGGGGLIQIPAMFATLPQVPVPTLLGTSKLAGVWGTATAAWRYGRAVRLDWGIVLPATLAAFVSAFCGALTLTVLPPDMLRQLLPFVLGFVAVYTFRRKDFGQRHEPLVRSGRTAAAAVATGALIGFYDGFFGPGTGSFLVFVFVRFFGCDFLHASAFAKIVNVACNLAALLWFGASGHLLIALGVLMAVFNVSGSVVGSYLAIRRGSRFVRKLFLIVVLFLIVRTAYDAWLR